MAVLVPLPVSKNPALCEHDHAYYSRRGSRGLKCLIRLRWNRCQKDREVGRKLVSVSLPLET
ncbi:hypothetical protein KIL84_002074, partial [Mauremys mutica]